VAAAAAAVAVAAVAAAAVVAAAAPRAASPGAVAAAAAAVAVVAVAAVAAAVVAAAAVRAPHPLRQRPSGRSYAPRSKGAPTCRQRLRWRAHEVLRHLLVAPSHLWHTTARAGAGSLRTRPAPRADRL
jgi:hypothetical protein